MSFKPIALPYPRWKIEQGLVNATALISINPVIKCETDKELQVDNFKEVTYLYFDDIPFDSLTKNGKCFIGPKVEDLQTAIKFSTHIQEKYTEEDILIAVHCAAGKSRSAAIALAINAQRIKTLYGNGMEHNVVQSLLDYDKEQQMCFNPKIIQMADELLGNGGALNNALTDLCAPYRGWKKYWKKFE